MFHSPGAQVLIAHFTEWLGVIAVAMFLARIPRLAAPPLGFKYPRRDGISALAVALIAVIFAVVLSQPQLRGFSARVLPLSGPSAQLSEQLFAALLVLLVVLAALLLRGQPGRGVGWGRDRLRIGLQTGIALALLTILLRNRAVDLLAGIPPERWMVLLPAAGIALSEETIFRGYMQPRLSWWIGDKRGWIITSIVYLLFRLPLLLVLYGLGDLWVPAAVVLGQGLVAGYLMRQSGHVLAPVFYRAISLWMDFFI